MADFKELLIEKRAWYKTIGKIYCPILKEYVLFNSKGFYHLRYDAQEKSTLQKSRLFWEESAIETLLFLVFMIEKLKTKIK